tara:strand:- start:570 stop:794 length:225 start_codon:yes stop_codon:yes gene_type:complete
MTVEIDGQRTEIQTFANNVESAIDNIVCMSAVDKLFNIVEQETNESWDFNEDITELRELRNTLPDNVSVMFGVG